MVLDICFGKLPILQHGELKFRLRVDFGEGVSEDGENIPCWHGQICRSACCSEDREFLLKSFDLSPAPNELRDLFYSPAQTKLRGSKTGMSDWAFQCGGGGYSHC